MPSKSWLQDPLTFIWTYLLPAHPQGRGPGSVCDDFWFPFSPSCLGQVEQN